MKASTVPEIAFGKLSSGRHQPLKHVPGCIHDKRKAASCVLASARPLSPLSLAVQMLTENTNNRKDRTTKEKKKPLVDEPSTTDKLSMSYGLSQEGSDAFSKPIYSFIYTNPNLVSSTWEGHKYKGRDKSRHRPGKRGKRSSGGPPSDADCDLGSFVTAMCVAGEENRKQRVAESISNIVSLSGTVFSAEVPTDLSGTVSPRYILPGSMTYKEDATNPSMLISRFKVDPTHLFRSSFESVETVPSVRSLASPVQPSLVNIHGIQDEIEVDSVVHSNMSDSHAEFSMHLRSFASVTSNRSSNASEVTED
ncbi:Hypothetical protein GLP15_2877 [Giardia lamblia P15]|uniref:Uncharacterized protein n=1 Tax=Giardia intestinalis (strain P15) TaxID=658858 RepID=E1F1Y1_GIAIA|nr:Hypothetical protein GLP15_2877 [Giardia lamblia P15]